ncbi:MAG: enterochelin esterase, partial [Elusimicrobia bacterium]
ARGKLEPRRVASEVLGNDRQVTVYTPPGYSPKGPPYPLLVLFDEEDYLNILGAAATLDNLTADRKIPPHVAMLVGNAPGEARAKELPCNPDFARYLSEELVPWVRREYTVASDPARTIIGGLSYGALAAACAAFRHPELFGNVLSQSGSYWHPGPEPPKPAPKDPYAEPNHVARLFAESPRLPLRFYLDAGSDELDYSARGGSILIPNRHLRDVLRAKGYAIRYQEFLGGHDYLSWRGTLADGLMFLAIP